MTGLGVADAEEASEAAVEAEAEVISLGVAEAVSLGAAEALASLAACWPHAQAGHQDPEGYRRSTVCGVRTNNGSHGNTFLVSV